MDETLNMECGDGEKHRVIKSMMWQQKAYLICFLEPNNTSMLDGLVCSLRVGTFLEWKGADADACVVAGGIVLI